MELDPFQPDHFQQGWRPQFRLITLLVAMVLFSVLAAGLAGLLRESAHAGGKNPHFFFFVLLVVAAPLCTIAIAGAIPPLKRLFRYLESRRQREEADDDE